MTQPPIVRTTLQAVAPYIKGKQIAVYLRGREKPLTGLTVCHIWPNLLIARWNSSTHLIPGSQISFIRFAPDCDPCRDINHPLYEIVRTKYRSTSAVSQERVTQLERQRQQAELAKKNIAAP